VDDVSASEDEADFWDSDPDESAESVLKNEPEGHDSHPQLRAERHSDLVLAALNRAPLVGRDLTPPNVDKQVGKVMADLASILILIGQHQWRPILRDVREESPIVTLTKWVNLYREAGPSPFEGQGATGNFRGMEIVSLGPVRGLSPRTEEQAANLLEWVPHRHVYPDMMWRGAQEGAFSPHGEVFRTLRRDYMHIYEMSEDGLAQEMLSQRALTLQRMNLGVRKIRRGEERNFWQCGSCKMFFLEEVTGHWEYRNPFVLPPDSGTFGTPGFFSGTDEFGREFLGPRPRLPTKHQPHTLRWRYISHQAVKVDTPRASFLTHCAQKCPKDLPRVTMQRSIRRDVWDISRSLLVVFLARQMDKFHTTRSYVSFLMASLRMLITIQRSAQCNTGELNSEQSFTKFHTQTFFAKAIGEKVLPKPPMWLDEIGSPPLFTGVLKFKLDRAICRRRKLDLSFLFSLMNTKNCWASLGPKKWFEGYKGHEERICKIILEKPPEDLLEAIRDASAHFVGKRIGAPTKLSPSPAGCTQAPRHDGGCYSLYDPFVEEVFTPQVEKTDLDEENPFDGDFIVNRRNLNHVKEFDQWRVSTWREGESRTTTREQWEAENLKNGVVIEDEVACDHSDFARVTGVDKPAGVRVLTVGCGYRGVNVMPSQGQILEAFCSNFQSTSQGDVETKLNIIMSRTEKLLARVVETPSQGGVDDELSDDSKWHALSGDYSDATDTIKRECTMAAFEPLPGYGLHSPKACEEALEPATLSYPKGWLDHPLVEEAFNEWSVTSEGQHMLDEKQRKKNERDAKAIFERGHELPSDECKAPVRLTFRDCPLFEGVEHGRHCSRQRNGQMMGNWLSFGLLNIVNIGAYHVALRRWYDEDPTARRMLIMKHLWRNFLVNGDDILFYCPNSFYPVWKKATEDTGFKLSVGKNYAVHDFAMINTRAFIRKGAQFVEFGYVNQRMIYGKGLSRQNPPTPDMLGSQVNKMIRLCPFSEGMIPAAMIDRRDIFSDLKTSTGFTPNWFVPAHLGGYGLDIRYLRGPLIVTPEQRRVAAWMVLHPDSSCLYTFKESWVVPVEATKTPLCLNEKLFCGRIGILPEPKAKNTVDEEDEVFQSIRKMFGEEEIPNFSLLEWEKLKRESTACLEQVNSWRMRLMAMENARKVHTTPPPILVPHAKAAMLKRTWITPISDEGLSRYWVPCFITTALPDCPPLGQIPYPEDYVRYIDRRNLIVHYVKDKKGFMKDPLGIMGIDYHWRSGSEKWTGVYQPVVVPDSLWERHDSDRTLGRFGLQEEELALWRGEEEFDGIELEEVDAVGLR